MSSAEFVSQYYTYDGIAVQLWSDGDLTDRLGRGFSRTRLPFWAAAVVAHEVAIYYEHELQDVIRAAKKLANKGTLSPDSLRKSV
jgi:hypothetical protein